MRARLSSAPETSAGARRTLSGGPGGPAGGLRGVDGAAAALDVHAQPGERLADEAGDLHLRHADLARDLRLREVLLEAQPQDLAVAGGEDVEGAVVEHADLGAAELRVGDADRVGERRVLADRLPRTGGAGVRGA